RVGKGFSRVETPLFESMLAVRDVAEEAEAQVPAQGDNVQEHANVEDVAKDVVHMATPSSLPHGIPSPPQEQSSPPHQPPCLPQPQDAEGSSLLFQQVLATCSALALRVKGLENDKVAQQLEIVKLKARVKKLKKINKVKSSKLRRLKKVGTSQRVESPNDVENVFNQGRIIVDIDQDEGIELVLSMQEDDTEVQEAVEIVTTAKLMIEVVTAAVTQVAAANPEEELSSDTPAETPKVKDKGKGILIEAPKPMKKKDQIEMDAEEEMEEEDEEIIKSINETPAQKASKRRKLHEQAKEDEDLKKQLEVVDNEDDDVFIEATPIGRKVPVVDYEIVMINNKPRYKIIKADGIYQLYISFITLLKNFDREDLEDLWRIMKAKFSTSKPTNFSDDYLLSTLKTMFEKTDGQDAIWRNQQSAYGQALVKS
nr:hypothetical protein [Tanacetum cinerariifolium]